LDRGPFKRSTKSRGAALQELSGKEFPKKTKLRRARIKGGSGDLPAHYAHRYQGASEEKSEELHGGSSWEKCGAGERESRNVQKRGTGRRRREIVRWGGYSGELEEWNATNADGGERLRWGHEKGQSWGERNLDKGTVPARRLRSKALSDYRVQTKEYPRRQHSILKLGAVAPMAAAEATPVPAEGNRLAATTKSP